jgi:arylsulfatase
LVSDIAAPTVPAVAGPQRPGDYLITENTEPRQQEGAMTMNHQEQETNQQGGMTSTNRTLMNKLSRRGFGLGLAGLALIWLAAATMAVNAAEDNSAAPRQPTRKPNLIVILTDDQGYQDLGCFGHPTIKTPRIDQLAKEGLRLTSFYVQPVCGPSRAALLTGCYPMRAGFPCESGPKETQKDVFTYLRRWRLNPAEITIAEVLKGAGYATGCVGKWDLSGRRSIPGEVPNDQGFDYYYGTLGANDPAASGDVVPLGLFDNRKEERKTADMGELTGLYTDKAIGFMRQNRNKPFFLYLAHSMPHVKLGASAAFKGKSAAGLYGDVIEEIDHNVGRLVDAIRELGLGNDTILLFTSDNGPWLLFKRDGGSALPLKDGKGSFSEGGFRVPAIWWGPGYISAGRESDEILSTLDVLPTFAALAGTTAPTDRIIDGKDQSAILLGRTDKSGRNDFFYYVWYSLCAVRQGDWKLVLPNKVNFTYAKEPSSGERPRLFNLRNDVSETTDMAEKHPEVVARLKEIASRAQEEIGDNDKPGSKSRPYSIGEGRE